MTEPDQTPKRQWRADGWHLNDMPMNVASNVEYIAGILNALEADLAQADREIPRLNELLTRALARAAAAEKVRDYQTSKADQWCDRALHLRAELEAAQAQVQALRALVEQVLGWGKRPITVSDAGWKT